MSQKTYRRTRAMEIRKDGPSFVAVLATETAVDRGDYVEVLRISPKTIDLSRFPVPLMRSHDLSELPVGVVSNPRFEGRQLVGDITLGDSEEAQELYKAISNGILRNVSIGYSVTETQPGDHRTIYVTRFQIHEVSLVSVNADQNAQIIKERAMTQSTVTREDLSEMLALAKRHNQIDLAEEAIQRGDSLPAFRERLLDRIADKPIDFAQVDDYLGLTPREERQFSLCRAIEAKASGNWSNAGFEREVLRETEKRSKHGGIVLPPHLMMKRDLITGSPAFGSNMVQTDVLGGSFIEALFQQSVVLDQCTSLTGNVGDLSIPKMASGLSAAWYGETATISESSPVVGQVSMSPRTIAGYTEISRRMIQQASTDVETLIRRDFANQIASALDNVIIEGGGANQPVGVLETNGIGSVVMGANGAAISYAKLVELVREIATDNALNGNLAFVTNPKVIAAMRNTPRQSSGVEGNFILNDTNTILGYPVLSTNNCTSDLTKGTSTGVCSAVVFGNWSDVLVAFWSNLELLVDQTTKSQQMIVSVRAITDIDVGIRHAESFAAIKDVTTA